MNSAWWDENDEQKYKNKIFFIIKLYKRTVRQAKTE